MHVNKLGETGFLYSLILSSIKKLCVSPLHHTSKKK